VTEIFKVWTFGDIAAEDPRSAVEAFIQKINEIGLGNFYFTVKDQAGQAWMVNVSSHAPVFMTVEDYVAMQQELGLAPEADPGDSSATEERLEPPKPRPAVPVTSPVHRPTRKPPTTPAPVDEAIPTDPREAVQQRKARRGGAK